MTTAPSTAAIPAAFQVTQSATITSVTPSKTVKVIALGGLEEIGRNCMAIEYDRDIIIVDAGLQFPESDMPGIDYIVPNVKFLKERKEDIRGLFVTHGHLDHTGGLPHIYQDLGSPPVFTLPFTAAMLKKKLEDFPQVKLDVHEVHPDDEIQVGVFKVGFFRVNHNIPDAVGLAIDTPEGLILHTGDWKFDHTPINEPATEFQKLAAYGARGVTLLCSDSTSVMKEGHAISEKVIGQNLEMAMRNAKGRIVVGSFSSLIPRIQQVIDIAQKLGKKVLLEGYSMKNTAEIAIRLQYLKAPQKAFASPKEVSRLPREKLVVICTGAQGESNAALMRIVNKEHRFLDVRRNDTIIFSSSAVPGNETSIQRLQDSLARAGVNIIHYKEMDIHTGGHAHRDDTKMMLQLTKPEYYLPLHGTEYFRKINAEIASQDTEIVAPDHCLLPDNGQIVEIKDGVATVTDQRIATDHVMVDGLGVGDISSVVLRDRSHMAGDGMAVVIARIDIKKGELVGSPDIVSRGFIYMKDNQGFIKQIRTKASDIVKSHCQNKDVDVNLEYVRNALRDELGEFLAEKTHRRPLVVPVLVEV